MRLEITIVPTSGKFYGRLKDVGEKQAARTSKQVEDKQDLVEFLLLH